jgi:hypothetical protein
MHEVRIDEAAAAGARAELPNRDTHVTVGRGMDISMK